MKVHPAPLLLTLVLFGPARADAAAPGHCAAATVTPVAGDPGAFRIMTPHGSMIARKSAAQAQLAPPAALCRVYPHFFDFDGDTIGTIRDTIVVEVGSTVAWQQFQPDFHTVTSGTDSGDLNAGADFNAILDGVTDRFEYTFTTTGKHDFFCFIHEPVMLGTVMVVPVNLGVKPGVIRRPSFTRAPSPNPARGDPSVSFAIALPRSAPVLLTVHDIAGRALATILDGALPAGEHAFRWSGRDRDGRLLQSGRYFIRMAAGGVIETKAVSLIR